MGALEGRAAIVSGGGDGIGRGIVLALAREGMDVVVVDRFQEPAQVVADEVAVAGSKAAVLVGDVREADLADRAVALAMERFGRLDGLVNGAQGSRSGVPFEKQTDEDFDLALSTGLWGTFRFMRASFEPLKARGGAIVNIVSGAGINGFAGFAAYAAAKEGMRGLTKVAAREWGVHGIRVNAIAPNATSPAARAYLDANPEERDRQIAGRAIKREGDAERDAGRTVAFLMGDDSSFITGSTVFVNGGLTIGA
jgi:NAD(P)-dependent dehydrogenase (short-subunit alcohol dehydrogenase family)